jgi:hypothetical protein
MAGKAGTHSLATVLARTPRDLDGFPVIDWAVSPLPLADPVLEREIRGIAAAIGHALRIVPGRWRRSMASPPPWREASSGWRSSSMSAALAGPGLDLTHVRVMRPPRGNAGRTMGFTECSHAGVFELMSRPRVVRAEDVHPVAASLIEMPRRETTGIVIG